jgi:pimeloyl-ACP methyl ester carboxylesterase
MPLILLAKLGSLLLVLASAGLARAADISDPLEVYSTPQRLVTLPDGRRMNLYCLGEGGPTVVFDAGWSSNLITWRRVQPDIAKTVRACAFDRAGSGFSDPGPLPRDTKAIVADLHALLKAARIPGPYVLVGHSMGGMDARLYASLYRSEVAGMVLVDPANPHQDDRFRAVSPAVAAITGQEIAQTRKCVELAEAGKLEPEHADWETCAGTPPASWPRSLRAASLKMNTDPAAQRQQLSEVENVGDIDSSQIDQAKISFGDMPLIVLTASDTARAAPVSEKDKAALGKVWMTLHDEAAALSTRGENRLVKGSGHFIHGEQPDVVIAAVLEVVAAARAK